MIVKIDSLDHNGRGITRVNDKVTFVSNALVGEIVDIVICVEKKNYNEAKVLKVISKSDKRINPMCPYYSLCGGCEIMHMDYESQVIYKRDKVTNILKKYANIDVFPLVFRSDKVFGYRNKITLHYRDGILGYMKKNSNKVIPILNCPLASDSINDFIENIKGFDLDELVIRSNQNGEVISTLVDKSLLININDFVFQVDINSFFQVNNYICSKIFDFVSENLDFCDVCLDLYSGVGTLSILASKKVSKVYAIEKNESSYKNAIVNLKLNNVNNVVFILGDVKEKIKGISENIDVIITDPPRSGMDNVTIDAILSFKPNKVIYISCNPMTLARDLNILKDYYSVNSSAVFDMFPNTSHVECVCVLDRK